MNRDLAAKPGVGISDAAQIAKKYDAAIIHACRMRIHTLTDLLYAATHGKEAP